METSPKYFGPFSHWSRGVAAGTTTVKPRLHLRKANIHESKRILGERLEKISIRDFFVPAVYPRKSDNGRNGGGTHQRHPETSCRSWDNYFTDLFDGNGVCSEGI